MEVVVGRIPDGNKETQAGKDKAKVITMYWSAIFWLCRFRKYFAKLRRESVTVNLRHCVSDTSAVSCSWP